MSNTHGFSKKNMKNEIVKTKLTQPLSSGFPEGQIDQSFYGWVNATRNLHSPFQRASQKALATNIEMAKAETRRTLKRPFKLFVLLPIAKSKGLSALRESTMNRAVRLSKRLPVFLALAFSFIFFVSTNAFAQEDAEWKKRVNDINQENLPYTKNLPQIDRVELQKVSGGESGFNKILERRIIEGERARQIASLWRGQKWDYETRASCYNPPFAIRFFSNGKLVLYAGVCWDCRQIGILKPIGGGQGFHPDTKNAKKLLKIFTDAFAKNDSSQYSYNSKLFIQAEPYTINLPEIDKVELQRVERNDGIKVLETKTLEGEEAKKIASLWREQYWGGLGARCHFPPYAVKFYSGDKLIVYASVCWECHNIGFSTLDFYQGFNAENDEAKKLFEAFNKVFSK